MISDPEERTWGMACHLAAFAGLVVPGLGFVLGPLVVWLIKKDQYPFVNEQGKESLNFQISVLIYGVAAGILAFTVILIPLVAVFLGALAIFNVVMIIVAAVAISNGQRFRYPLAMRLIS